MGGEKAFQSKTNRQNMGSPPRGRGKVPYPQRGPEVNRITPAWAGKREQRSVCTDVHEDHPRVGGEKAPVLSCGFIDLGSPPRGRGKAYCGQVNDPLSGITPAWAGKRYDLLLRHYLCGDHPRVGGEKRATRSTIPATLGSPPRGRGKVLVILGAVKDTGITPAWAGKS